MMITLFTIVHYRYHPTPDRKKREIMAEWSEGGGGFPLPSLVGFVLRGEFVRSSGR